MDSEIIVEMSVRFGRISGLKIGIDRSLKLHFLGDAWKNMDNHTLRSLKSIIGIWHNRAMSGFVVDGSVKKFTYRSAIVEDPVFVAKQMQSMSGGICKIVKADKLKFKHPAGVEGIDYVF